MSLHGTKKPIHTRSSETWSDLRPLRGRKPEGQVHGQEEPYCLNDHDTDAIEVDSPSRRNRYSRTRRRPIRLSAEDAARVQREAWSDVEPAEEKQRGLGSFAAFVFC